LRQLESQNHSPSKLPGISESPKAPQRQKYNNREQKLTIEDLTQSKALSPVLKREESKSSPRVSSTRILRFGERTLSRDLENQSLPRE